jgi:hypothetical protein
MVIEVPVSTMNHDVGLITDIMRMRAKEAALGDMRHCVHNPAMSHVHEEISQTVLMEVSVRLMGGDADGALNIIGKALDIAFSVGHAIGEGPEHIFWHSCEDGFDILVVED